MAGRADSAKESKTSKTSLQWGEERNQLLSCKNALMLAYISLTPGNEVYANL